MDLLQASVPAFNSISVIATPLILNLIMSFMKKIGGLPSQGHVGFKRTLLGMFAVLGAFSASALNGTPIDVDSVTQLVQLTVESVVLFLMSHATYSLLWDKK